MIYSTLPRLRIVRHNCKNGDGSSKAAYNNVVCAVIVQLCVVVCSICIVSKTLPHTTLIVNPPLNIPLHTLVVWSLFPMPEAVLGCKTRGGHHKKRGGSRTPWCQHWEAHPWYWEGGEEVYIFRLSISIFAFLNCIPDIYENSTFAGSSLLEFIIPPSN